MESCDHEWETKAVPYMGEDKPYQCCIKCLEQRVQCVHNFMKNPFSDKGWKYKCWKCMKEFDYKTCDRCGMEEKVVCCNENLAPGSACIQNYVPPKNIFKNWKQEEKEETKYAYSSSESDSDLDSWEDKPHIKEGKKEQEAKSLKELDQKFYDDTLNVINYVSDSESEESWETSNLTEVHPWDKKTQFTDEEMAIAIQAVKIFYGESIEEMCDQIKETYKLKELECFTLKEIRSFSQDLDYVWSFYNKNKPKSL